MTDRIPGGIGGTRLRRRLHISISLLTSLTTVAAQDCPVAAPANGALGECANYRAHGLQVGDSCTPDCADGYEVHGRYSRTASDCFNNAASCRSASSATIRALQDSCSAPTGIDQAASTACAEGSSVAHGSFCTTRCAGSWVGVPASLACSFGKLFPPTFECMSGCRAPEVANSAAPGSCKEGGVVDTTCTPQCAEKYIASESKLSCVNGSLSPKSFTCTPQGCEPPVGITRSLAPICAEGANISHGGSCSGLCESGFVASPPSLACGLGALSPPVFWCVPSGCKAPEVPFVAEVSCLEGRSLIDGGTCTAQCAPGYRPTAAVLSCHRGELSPSDFVCEPAGCDAPMGVQGAANVSCVEGDLILHGSSCTSHCVGTGVPSPPTLSCGLGKLSPETFECLPNVCRAPTDIVLAHDQPCREGTEIAYGGVCTPRCQEGYVPSTSSLECVGFAFSPPTFHCLPMSCQAPAKHIANAADLVCRDGLTIRHGRRCEAQCEPGFSPYPASLSCGLGILRPSTFECRAIGCTAPAGVRFAKTPACEEGKYIGDGALCTAVCAQGYAPSVSELSCHGEVLTPSTFSCYPTTCTLPRVAGAAERLCVEGHMASLVHGGTCTVECRAGFQLVGARELRCLSGNLTAANFECVDTRVNENSVHLGVFATVMVFVALGSVGLVVVCTYCGFHRGVRSGIMFRSDGAAIAMENGQAPFTPAVPAPSFPGAKE